MYIIIFEDGSIKQATELDEGLLPAADDGLVDIIDISTHKDPLQYLDEGWCSLDDV
jgi:hypothetical protein